MTVGRDAALARPLGRGAGATAAQVKAAMRGLILGQGLPDRPLQPLRSAPGAEPRPALPYAMVKLFLSGDVMTGRGVDQILGHPGDPRLWEPYIRDARRYVKLAEAVSGQIPRPAGDVWIWGDALRELHRIAPDARIINLETSVTVSDRPWRGKEVHYRMHPGNVGCLTAAAIDVCVLANNHVLDFGYEGPAETLQTLRRAGVQTAGAGSDLGEARGLPRDELVATASGSPG